MQKIENRLRFDKVTESLKVGPFSRHSVYAQYVVKNRKKLQFAVAHKMGLSVFDSALSDDGYN